MHDVAAAARIPSSTYPRKNTKTPARAVSRPKTPKLLRRSITIKLAHAAVLGSIFTN